MSELDEIRERLGEQAANPHVDTEQPYSMVEHYVVDISHLLERIEKLEKEVEKLQQRLEACAEANASFAANSYKGARQGIRDVFGEARGEDVG